jgi:hypothetical protein
MIYVSAGGFGSIGMRLVGGVLVAPSLARAVSRLP